MARKTCTCQEKLNQYQSDRLFSSQIYYLFLKFNFKNQTVPISDWIHTFCNKHLHFKLNLL